MPIPPAGVNWSFFAEDTCVKLHKSLAVFRDVVYIYTHQQRRRSAVGHSVSSKDVIRALEADGWQELPRNGSSHRKFRKPGRTELVVVQHPRKDMPLGTLRQIEKTSGLKLR
ncbi:type II toxin-antitoxin system HicA family toxin [Roseomonas sp. USHLN139]|uniref:type II toxin-antitoxin system HicA family toxin n=1 Tax=Roseomonas sp. USHLN139 TaxID=3081298 RepID=UPI003FA75C58